MTDNVWYVNGHNVFISLTTSSNCKLFILSKLFWRRTEFVSRLAIFFSSLSILDKTSAYVSASFLLSVLPTDFLTYKKLQLTIITVILNIRFIENILSSIRNFMESLQLARVHSAWSFVVSKTKFRHKSLANIS